MGAKPMTIRGWIRRIWIASGLLLTAWLAWNFQAHGVPSSVYTADESVDVVDADGYVMFSPRHVAVNADVAIAFLPGGLVAPDAYAPVVRALAAHGIPASLVRLPYRSAMTAGMRETLWARVMEAHARMGPGRRLVLAGHSRGAALAAAFAADQPEIEGLALIGTTHPRDRDLSHLRYPVMRILGTRDCVAPIATARAGAHNLPRQTEVVEIDGANHAQFGYYGTQINDCSASISREQQQRQLIDALVRFVR
ncbi:MAG TPA: alpha/beta hydrolase [Vicinamibacterales bacterium]|nr:alpha/beta hydrolase [Vicinamibacterales bacterium]